MLRTPLLRCDSRPARGCDAPSPCAGAEQPRAARPHGPSADPCALPARGRLALPPASGRRERSLLPRLNAALATPLCGWEEKLFGFGLIQGEEEDRSRGCVR